MTTPEDTEKAADVRFEKLETHAIKTEGRLDTIERTLGDHGGKLDRIVAVVTRQEGRPVTDVHKNVSTVRDVVVILSALSALALWFFVTMSAKSEVATQLQFQHMKELQEAKLTYLRERQDWIVANITKWPAKEERVQ